MGLASIVTALVVTVLPIQPAAADEATSPPGTPDLICPPPNLYGHAVRRIPTRHKAVLLTFNAAWNADGVREALTTLRKKKVPAAFFLGGRFAQQHPASARAMAKSHVIGNHSHTHPRFTRMDLQEQHKEILTADRAIARAIGRKPDPLFRFPYNEVDARSVRNVNATGRVVLDATTDTDGYLGKHRGHSVRSVVAQAVRHLRPGAVIQMHVGNPDRHRMPLDVEALPALINAIRAHGYQFIDPHDLLLSSYRLRPHK